MDKLKDSWEEMLGLGQGLSEGSEEETDATGLGGK